MSTSRFNRLLERHMLGKATPEESVELEKMLSDGTASTEIEDAIEAALLNTGMQEDTVREDIKLRAKKISQRILSNRKVKRIQYLWVAAAVLVLAITSTYVVVKKHTVDKSTANIGETEHIVRGKNYVVLPDNSTVTMNEGSELIYSDSYGERLREVRLKGEAYFSVKPDKLHAFVVHTGSVQTHVLGTEFNVNASRQNDVVVTVRKGKVQVLDDMHEIGVIAPNQQISVNTFTHQSLKTDVKAEIFIAWKSKFLTMHDVRFEEAVKLIGQKYNVKVNLDDRLKDCIVRFSFLNDESLTEVLDVITKLSETTCTKKDDHIILTGKGCN